MKYKYPALLHKCQPDCNQYIQLAAHGTLSILSDKPATQTAARFIEAIKYAPDDAWAFVSRLYSTAIDFQELQALLHTNAQPLKYYATYQPEPKNYQTRSIYVAAARKLLHLRMVREPDHNGQWKICRVEQEDCRKI